MRPSRIAEVSEDRVPAREVARTWLQQEGFIGGGS